MDAKDILGLHKNSFPSSLDKKSRPPKESQRKPDGISREVRLFIHYPLTLIHFLSLILIELYCILLGLCTYWWNATSYAIN